jgi:sRNA-binding protein
VLYQKVTSNSPTVRSPDVLATIGRLAEKWPKAFHVFERRRKPLKIGVDTDIVAGLDGAITLPELRAAMRSYTGNLGYLLASKEGAVRVDLQGDAAGVVTATEAKWAAMRLDGLRRHKAARKAAKGPGVPVHVEAVASAPKRLSLADLKRAAQERKTSAATEVSVEV